MPILDRKKYQSIRIGDKITVTILGREKISGEIRIGIQATKEITILREEIYPHLSLIPRESQ